MNSRKRSLIIIGGRESKEGEKLILREVANRIGTGKLVVTTVASSKPEGIFEEYERIFRGLGVRHLFKLAIDSREEAKSEKNLSVLEDAAGIFFTGGDQLKITSQIGDTPIYSRVQEIYRQGGVIVGTSAGASVMSETMLVSGPSEESHRIGGSLRLAPGLGLISGVIIDQHFAERGRIGRLLGAVALNPRNLGIGIDENTAIVVDARSRFRVVGEGAVYVIDGSDVSYSNMAEGEVDRTLSIFDVRLHLLSQGDTFDMRERRAANHPAEEVEERVKGDE